MDQPRFDQWTRSFVTASTRRATVRTFAGAVLAGAALLRSGAQVDAKCVPIGKRCRRKKHRCCNGGHCRGKQCRCKPGRVWCNGKCIPGQCCQDADCTAGDAGRCDPQHQCHYKPACLGTGNDCWFDHECCSGGCNNLHCVPSSIGEPCRQWNHCQSAVSMMCWYYTCLPSDVV